jgi:hypothetical protein
MRSLPAAARAAIDDIVAPSAARVNGRSQLNVARDDDRFDFDRIVGSTECGHLEPE